MINPADDSESPNYRNDAISGIALHVDVQVMISTYWDDIFKCISWDENVWIVL